MKKIVFIVVSAIFLAATISTPAFCQNAQRKLRVEAEKASIFMEPDAAGTIVGYAARKTILTSYSGENGWYRVVLPADKDNVAVIGYIAAKDVTVLEETTSDRPDFWNPAAKAFNGLGLEFEVGAGLTYFGGGDFPGAVHGRYDQYADSFAALGYAIIDRTFKPFHKGAQYSADLAFHLSPRLSVGLKGGYLSGSNLDQFAFMEGTRYPTAVSHPFLSVFIIRPNLAFRLPISKLLSIRLEGGPALFMSKLQYSRSIETTTFNESLAMSAKANALGLQAGVGMELNLNERISMVLLATGQIARASGFTGDESFSHSVIRDFRNVEIQGWRYHGPLYFYHDGAYPALAIRPDKPSADARESVFDFSGISLSFGLRLKI